MTIEIRPLAGSDIAAILAADVGEWWLRDETYWRGIVAEQATGIRSAVIAAEGVSVLAYANLLWRSDYPGFQKFGIPEINNLRVAKRFRKRGIGSAVIAHFEALARSARRSSIGVGVGLYADYGAAQRLYAKLGYVPDGGGITRNYLAAEPGAFVRVDDDLLLWLVKQV
jgi:GNAT superfamily N-acetyltransferase